MLARGETYQQNRRGNLHTLYLSRTFLGWPISFEIRRACTFIRGGPGVPEVARDDRVEDAVFAGTGEWARVVGRLKDEVGETAYRSWLRSMRLDRIEGGEGVIAVPTRFLRNWVATHYADRLLALWRTENERMRRLAIIVEPRVPAFAPPKAEAASAPEPVAPAEPPGAPDI